MKNPNNTYLAERGIFFEGSGANFESETQSDKVYTIELDNTGTAAEDKVIALVPGDGLTAAELTTLLGTTVHAVVADGTIISTADKVVTAAGTPGKLLSFLKRVRRAPQRFSGMTIEVSNVAQLSQPIKIFKDNPYTGDPVIENQIYPNSSKSNTQNNEKLVHIPLNMMQFDSDRIVITTLKANTTMTITLVPGGHMSPAELLENEAVKEFNSKNLNRVYANQK